MPSLHVRRGSLAGSGAMLVVLAIASITAIWAQDKQLSIQPISRQQTLDVPTALKSVASVVVYDKTDKAIGQGSGFFVDSEGKLVTNFHVIKMAASAVVKCADGGFYQVAGVLATDEKNDLAVLKVSGKDFKVLSLADSNAVRVGDKVLAIGSPLGLEETVSDGLISGIREIEGVRVFQTTAAISPGSSGGALLNVHGQVVGVTAFQLTAGQSLNFAVPANYLKPLLAGGRVVPFTPAEPLDFRPEEPNEAKGNQQTPETAPTVNIPRYWTHLADGTTVEVRLDGDFLYEMSEQDVEDGPFRVHVNCICESRRHGNRWVGKCRWRYQIHGGISTPSICTLETEEVVTFVSPTRIEGEGQTVEPGGESQSCPRAGSSKEQFSLIPRDGATN
jgi:Trypsin-like peptidase domain